MQDTVTTFQQWLFEAGRATKTIESYSGDVKGFKQFLTEKIPKEHQPLTRFAFVRYKEQLIQQNYAVTTINKKVNSLKVYNDFLRSIGILTNSVVTLKRDRITIAAGSESTVNALSEEQVEQLLFYVEDRNKVSTRNKLIVYLLLYTGVRVSELVNIKLADIDFLTSHLQIIGKGGKQREIGLKQEVLHLVRAYMKEERSASVFDESSYLLVSQRAEKMHRDAVRSWLANISGDVGFKLHPHLFRHTFCTRLLKKGVDLTTVSKLAGHSTINMTAKFYIQITKAEKMDAINRL